MPISIVVGGQFGSEGKGKVALAIACKYGACAVVRVGGTNSGHTAYDDVGQRWALRQLPVSVLNRESIAVLPPGAIIDPEIFQREVDALNLGVERVAVSPYATVIAKRDKEAEGSSGLVAEIGSTGSGTGAALVRRIARNGMEKVLARDSRPLRPYVRDTSDLMQNILRQKGRIVIEGSQGFGLSLLHGYYPHVTSRDTSAATFLGEAGLSPRDVDDITLVLRCYPIRVAGTSGPLKGETTWTEIAKQAGLPKDYCELTTATRKVRRVGAFDPDLVKRAIAANDPSRIVLNHFDYVDSGVRDHEYSQLALDFIDRTEKSIGRKIDWVGTSPTELIERSAITGIGHSSRIKMVAPARR